MSNLVMINLEHHRSILTVLIEEFFTWVYTEIKKNYDIDVLPTNDISYRDFAEIIVDEFAFFTPPKGISYLVLVDEQVAGVGALRNISKDSGEITRMYIRPKYRGKGLGKTLLQQLLEKGTNFGFSAIYLHTASFMENARQIYEAFGFIERDEYPEAELPENLKKYFLFMEKQL